MISQPHTRAQKWPLTQHQKGTHNSSHMMTVLSTRPYRHQESHKISDSSHNDTATHIHHRAIPTMTGTQRRPRETVTHTPHGHSRSHTMTVTQPQSSSLPRLSFSRPASSPHTSSPNPSLGSSSPPPALHPYAGPAGHSIRRTEPGPDRQTKGREPAREGTGAPPAPAPHQVEAAAAGALDPPRLGGRCGTVSLAAGLAGGRTDRWKSRRPGSARRRRLGERGAGPPGLICIIPWAGPRDVSFVRSGAGPRSLVGEGRVRID